MFSKQECQRDKWPKIKLLIIVPRNTKEQFLGTLINAYESNGVDVDFLHYKNEVVPDGAEIKQAIKNKDYALYIFPGRRSPRSIINNLFLTSEEDKKVPVGIVPNTRKLQNFIEAAVKVHSRPKDDLSLALLAQRHPRYIKLADRIETIMNSKKNDVQFFKWTSDIIFREDMIDRLKAGLGIALYIGHGRPNGWVGYYGLRSHHFEGVTNPLGCLISLCCHTANRRKIGLSFAEQMVLNGAATSSLGAVSSTLHTNNTRWAVQIVDILSNEINTIGELLLNACPINPMVYKTYRLIGDPLAPLHATPEGIKYAKTINIYQ